MAMAILFFLFLLAGSAAAADVCSSETFSSNRVFAACKSLPHLSAALHWTYDNRTGALSIAFSAPPAAPNGWIAWAINPSGPKMDGAQTLVAFKQGNGAVAAKMFKATGYTVTETAALSFPVSGLAAEDSGDGRLRLFATLTVPEKGVTQVWQVGSSVTNGVPDQHATGTDNLAAMGALDLVSGVVAGDAGDAAAALLRRRNTHGILNAVSWGVLLPMGALFARYLKLFADPAWFYLHITCQVIGYAVGVSGWATGLKLGSESKGVTYSTHRSIGIALFTLATLQLSALFVRPTKDHKYRVYWNAFHHSFGYTIIILGVINIFKGMDILDISDNWKTAYIVVICVLAGIALLVEAVTWVVVIRRRKAEVKHQYNGSSNGLRHLSP